jgi:hypothetical protein
MTPAEIRTLVKNIFTKLRDHAGTLGVFEHVEGHALINPPTSGVAVAFEAGPIRPGAQYSGLAATSLVFTCTASIYTTLQSQPADDIEVDISAAAAALMWALSGDFDLGGLVRNVDLLGATGVGLSADPGYLKLPDGGSFRASVVTIPMVINDVLDQVS